MSYSDPEWNPESWLMWFCCIKEDSYILLKRQNLIILFKTSTFQEACRHPGLLEVKMINTVKSWILQAFQNHIWYKKKVLDFFYQKVFETSIDQLNFMNLVDGEIDSDLHTFTQFIESCLMQHNHYLVLQTANYDFFLQICCQNKFSSVVKFPKELFITIHSFKNLWIWHQTYLIFPVWNLESRQIIVSSYKKHKNRFFGGDR